MEREKPNLRTAATVISSTIAVFLWIYYSYRICYNAGYVGSPKGTHLVVIWNNVQIDFYIPLLVGVLIILIYASLTWKYFSSKHVIDRVVVIMTFVWGVFIFLVTYLLIQPLAFSLPPPPGYVPPIYLMFFGGEFAVMAVSITVILMKPLIEPFKSSGKVLQ